MLFQNGIWSAVASKCIARLDRGDRLHIETPGGGGFGQSVNQEGDAA